MSSAITYSFVFFLLLAAPAFGETWQEYLDAQKAVQNIEHGVVLSHEDAEIKAITFGSPISKSEALAGAKSFDVNPNDLKQIGLFYGGVHYDIHSVIGDHMYGSGAGESLIQIRLDAYVLGICCIGPMEKCQPHAEEIADWLRDNIGGQQNKE